MSETIEPGSEDWWEWDYHRNKSMYDAYAAVWAKIPADVQAELEALHETYLYDCCGHNEGLYCCIDYLDGRVTETYLKEKSKKNPAESDLLDL